MIVALDEKFKCLTVSRIFHVLKFFGICLKHLKLCNGERSFGITDRINTSCNVLTPICRELLRIKLYE